MRLASGALGNRNGERFSLTTPSGAVGIHGATFIVEYFAPSQQALASMRSWLLASTAGLGIDPPLAPLQLVQMSIPTPPAGGLPPGLYVHVIDGIINLSNKGGSQSFAAGQFGFTASLVKPPVIVPINPGLKFTPPPAFSAASNTASSSSGTNKAAAIDCVVR